MKNKKILLILIVVFIILLGGATILYQKLGQNYQPEQMGVRDDVAEKEPAEDGGTGAVQEEMEAEPEEKDEEEELYPAPDFTVYDMEGNEVHLSDYLGKPVVVNFWASWCGPCKSEMPDFDAAYQEVGDEVQFLMVNMTDNSRETVEVASEFVAEQGYTFPVFYDMESNAAMTYQVFSLPTTYFIDSEGYSVAYATGAIDENTLQKGIEMILP